jgi:hypothetical protein
MTLFLKFFEAAGKGASLIKIKDVNKHMIIGLKELKCLCNQISDKCRKHRETFEVTVIGNWSIREYCFPKHIELFYNSFQLIPVLIFAYYFPVLK